MTFSWSRTLALWLCVALLDLLLLFVLPNLAVFGLLISKAESGASVEVDDVVGSRDALFDEEHLLGEYTVRIQPWATARLNPDGLNICLPTSTPPPHSQGLSEDIRRPLRQIIPPSVRIPLSLTGKGPWNIEYAIIDPNGARSKSYTFEADRANTFIDAAILGKYQLLRMTEANGTEGRIITSEYLLSACPEARFTAELLAEGIALCVDQPFRLPIWLKAAVNPESPVAAIFTLISSKGKKTLTIGECITDVNAEQDHGFKKCAAHFDGLPAKGEYLLRVDMAEDKEGFIRKYGEYDLGDGVVLYARDPPVAGWLHKSQDVPRLLDDGKPANLKIGFTGNSPPYSLSYKHELGEPTIIQSISGSSTSISVDKPGIISLVSFSDQVCNGIILPPADLTIQKATLPTVKVSAEPVKSMCIGNLGIKFVLELSGEGPWLLDVVEELRGHQARRSSLSINSPRFDYMWAPSQPGDYRVDFKSLSDAWYRNVPLTGMHYEQTVYPMPDARFSSHGESSELYSCFGGSDILEVSLSGIGPWILSLEHEFPQGPVDSSSLQVPIEIPSVPLKLMPHKIAGRHVIRLVSVTDSNNCIQNIKGQSITITVFPNVPSVSFAGRDSDFVIKYDQSHLIPLKLSGNQAPWTIEYMINDQKGKQILPAGTKGLQVSQAGLYRLLSVKDQYCTGNVQEPAEVYVRLLERPDARFLSSSEAICADRDNQNLPIKLEGKGPWLLNYTLQYSLDKAGLSHAKIDSRQVAFSADKSGLAELRLEQPRPAGYFRFSLVSITDVHYDNVQISGTDKMIDQHVVSPPSAHFKENTRTVFCASTLDQNRENGLPLELYGQAPFIIEYEISHKGQSSVFSATNLPLKDAFLPFSETNVPGIYQYSIVKVSDATGCEWLLRQNEKTSNRKSVSIQILEAPSIALVANNSQGFCAGDVARFELKGLGPWTVTYALERNGLHEASKKTDTSSAATLSLLLAEAGTLRFTSVCNAFCCFSGDSLPILKIHALPSAVIDFGSAMIREGESTEFAVKLTGEPPFEFVYQRHLSGSKDVKNILIENVDSNIHKIQVSEDGTFKVISIKDRFCQYPRANL